MLGKRKKARVVCEVAYVELEGDDAREVEGVCVTCGQCGHETESFGTSEASIRRCCVLLREECPECENNYYVTEEED